MTRGYFEEAQHYWLDDFDNRYVEFIDTRTNLRRVRLLADSIADVEDAIDMIELLLEKYQMHYKLHPNSSWFVQFPYLLIEPKPGDQIFNRDNNEVYTVKTVSLDPHTRIWDHWVELEGYTAPGHRDSLQWVDRKSNLVRFTLAYTVAEAKETQAAGGELGDKQYGPWRPTITARVTKREPWATDRPFGDRKQLKPREFEIFRDREDPARTSIIVWRQAFDNLVRFDCWEQDPLKALILNTWFERFMDLYTGVLKRNGVGEILYWERRDIQANERWRDELVGYYTQYFMRTDQLNVNRHRNLTDVVFRVRVAKHPMGAFGGNPITGEAERLWFGRTHNDTGGYLYGTFEIEDHGAIDPRLLPDDGSLTRDARNQFNPHIRERD